MSTIMIVDDAQFVRQHVGRVLGEAGFVVIEATDGEDAVVQLRAHPEVALVFCDVNMPKRNGIELLETLRGDPALMRVKVVMLTTEGQGELIRKAKSLGALGWIVKPFKPEALVATARRLAGAVSAA